MNSKGSRLGDTPLLPKTNFQGKAEARQEKGNKRSMRLSYKFQNFPTTWHKMNKRQSYPFGRGKYKNKRILEGRVEIYLHSHSRKWKKQKQENRESKAEQEGEREENTWIMAEPPPVGKEIAPQGYPSLYFCP